MQLWDPFVAYLRHGADPPVLARSFALGFCLGLCPFVGEQLFCVITVPP